jgi:hypothetical protein
MTSEDAFSGSGRGEVTGIQNFFFRIFSTTVSGMPDRCRSMRNRKFGTYVLQHATVSFNVLFNLDQFSYFLRTIFYLQDIQTWFLSK